MAYGKKTKKGVNMEKNFYFKTDKLSVGYNNKAIITDIDINIKKGEIFTLIGPNGSGKSTILKTITKQLSKIAGLIYIENLSLENITNKEMAKKLAVVLTERIKPEMMSCEEVVATGRYPYTNHFGLLTKKDREIVRDSLDRVHALDIADKDFTAISDGQRQRIMLARAICQQPEIIVLDEPTSFLDIRHKIELLNILRKMAKEENITVIMSLHEIDLASKISDRVMCVKGDKISAIGTPEEIFVGERINELYDIKNGYYNMAFGSVELSKPEGEPQIFVIAGAGKGIPIYRKLQKKGIPFSTGIIYDNDVDYQIAKVLAQGIYFQKAFNPIGEDIYIKALGAVKNSKYVIDAGSEIGEFNRFNRELVNFAKENNKLISLDKI